MGPEWLAGSENRPWACRSPFPVSGTGPAAQDLPTRSKRGLFVFSRWGHSDRSLWPDQVAGQLLGQIQAEQFSVTQ